MLKIQVTYLNGRSRTLEVDQVEFLRSCPYCRLEFATINPDKVYCRDSHRIKACAVRSYDRAIPHYLLHASTIRLTPALPRLH